MVVGGRVPLLHGRNSPLVGLLVEALLLLQCHRLSWCHALLLLLLLLQAHAAARF